MRNYSLCNRQCGAFPAWSLLLASAALCAPAITGQQPAQSPAPAQQQPPAPTASPAPKPAQDEPAITEQDLRLRFIGKTFYLRGRYLNDSLHFTADGKLDGASPQASYTLSLVQIQNVHLEKHKLELEGTRYGVHFLGALASEDQSAASEKVQLTTKKKPLKIEIDRERVDTAFEKKQQKLEEKQAKTAPAKPAAGATPAPASTAPNSTNPATQPPVEPDVALSNAQANKTLRDALDRIFAPGLDDRMLASLPAYWQLYYHAISAKSDYRPADPAVLLQSQVDQKAKLLRAFDPPSNEYAQANAIVGIAMYHVVVGADGKPAEIAVGRPIGFGLDENAVENIRKATFQPAMKQGQPVPVLVDLTVRFRIYSKLTSTPAEAQTDAAKPQPPSLPGPDSTNTSKQQP
jgi:TonB family protein